METRMIKIVKVEDLKGNELLAKGIIAGEFTELVAAGCRLNTGMIAKLKEFGITEVFVRDEKFIKPQDLELVSEKTRSELKTKVKKIILNNKTENQEVVRESIRITEQIIDEIVNIEEVQEHLFEVSTGEGNLYDHLLNVCATSILTGLKMDLNKEQLHDMGVAGLLHDVGLNYVDIDYRDVDIEMMEESIQKLYKKHAQYGYEMVAESPWISDYTKNIILYHHEKNKAHSYDNNQRFGLEFDIIQVCDVFDEMVMGIGCKKVKTYQALEFLRDLGKLFYNEKVIAKFMEFVAAYPVGSVVYTTEHEIAVIIRQNRNFPDRPVLKIIKDSEGNTKTNVVIKDMCQESDLFIEEVLD